MKMKTLITASMAAFLVVFSNQFVSASNSQITHVAQKSIPIAQYYEGGEEALLADIQKELVYPIMAKKARKQGQCVIQLTLKADGTTSTFKIVSELGYGTGQEALRVVKTLKFKPAGYDQVHNVPVTFSLK